MFYVSSQWPGKVGGRVGGQSGPPLASEARGAAGAGRWPLGVRVRSQGLLPGQSGSLPGSGSTATQLLRVKAGGYRAPRWFLTWGETPVWAFSTLA